MEEGDFQTFFDRFIAMEGVEGEREALSRAEEMELERPALYSSFHPNLAYSPTHTPGEAVTPLLGRGFVCVVQPPVWWVTSRTNTIILADGPNRKYDLRTQ